MYWCGKLHIRGTSIATTGYSAISFSKSACISSAISQTWFGAMISFFPLAHPVPLPVMTPGLLLFTTIFIVLYINLIINVITIIMPFDVNGRFLSSLLVMVWLYYVPLVKRMLNPHELQCKNDPSTCRVSEKLAQWSWGGKAKLFCFFVFLNTNCFLAHGLCLKIMSFSCLFYVFPSCCIGRLLDWGCPGKFAAFSHTNGRSLMLTFAKANGAHSRRLFGPVLHFVVQAQNLGLTQVCFHKRITLQKCVSKVKLTKLSR